VFVQNPNFLGAIERLPELATVAKDAGALAVAAVDAISLGVLRPPGECGFDIALGEGQPLGQHQHGRGLPGEQFMQRHRAGGAHSPTSASADGSTAAPGGGTAPAPRRVAEGVVDACIGDSADYYIRRDGTLWVKGLAHRGQYGDGRLTATADFVNTAGDAVAVKAHTGHALYLSQGGVVMGTGGNRYGPLGAHGLGDKAERWGRAFDGARAIATGSRHSVAIRTDGTLWAWGGGFGIEPRRLLEGVVAVAAGNTATIALRADGSLLQWDGGAGPRRLRVL